MKRLVIRGLPRLAAVIFLAGLIAVVGALPALAAPAYTSTIRDARAAAAELLGSTGAASMSMALVDGDNVVWRQGFGYADRASSTVPGESTMYGIGSVSKMIATAAAMQLVDDGLIDLDAPVVRYLPQFRMATPDYRQITVRMLLNHTSGLPGSEYRNCIASEMQTGYADQMLETLSTQRLKYAPGQMAVYCNDGFTMIEPLVFAVTGKSYIRYVQDEIFDPLGMTHSSYPTRVFADGTYAKCYSDDEADPQEYVGTFASGAVYSTPTDMGRFASMLMNGGTLEGHRILTADAVAEMAQDEMAGTFNPVPKNGCRFGLGWDSIQEPGLRAVRVTGWMKGGDSSDYHAAFTVAPGAKLACVIEGVAPLDSGKLEILAQRVLLHALVDKGVIARMPAKLSTTPVAPPVANATAAQLKAVTGYFAQYNYVFHGVVSNTRSRFLTIKSVTPSGETTMMTNAKLRTDGHFWVDGKPAWISALSAGGRTYLYVFGPSGYGHFKEYSTLGQKVLAGSALSGPWAARVGHDWLLVNELPDTGSYLSDGGAVMRVSALAGLPGYIYATVPDFGPEIVDASAGDDLASMFLQVPQGGSRDQNDLIAFDRGGAEWMSFGSMVMRPASGLPTLPPGGSYSLPIGAEGYAEWSSLTATSALEIDGAQAWRLYDADMRLVSHGETETGVAHAPEPGSRIVVFGKAGDHIGVHVTAEARDTRRPTRAVMRPARGLD